MKDNSRLQSDDPSKLLESAFDKLSSDSSGIARLRYQEKVDRAVEEQSQAVRSQLLKERDTKESEFWHKNYDYLLKRSIDLGVGTLHKFVEQERKLTRREQTEPFLWRQLSDSAEDSNDSLKHAKFEHPLLIARQKWQT